jgi:hypothetical protein
MTIILLDRTVLDASRVLEVRSRVLDAFDKSLLGNAALFEFL